MNTLPITMATATSPIMANTLVFDDIFLELQNELETDGHNWHINNIYVNFEKELRAKELNQIMIHSQQDQFQITSTSNKYSNKTTKDCLFFYKLPDYLLASNRSFQATFFPELRRTFNPLDFQDLQQLAILTRQISIIHQYQQLWHYFLQCGTGQIRPRERPLLSRCTIEKQLSFWPQIVTSILMSEEIIPQVEDRQNEEIDQNIYINFIQNYLDQLHKKMNLCRHQFNTIKSRIQNYSDILINKIDHFIQNQSDILTIKFHVQTKIALIKYSYSDRSYQWEFGKQKPTKLQLDVAQQICSLTLEKEMAEQEMILFKFGILFKKLPKFLDILELSPPTAITTISDLDIRQRLSNAYERSIQRTRADLTNVLTSAVEAKRDICQKKFDQEIAEIWKNQHELLMFKRLTSTMLTFIERRQKNLIECIKYIYELKEDFFVKVPSMDVIH